MNRRNARASTCRCWRSRISGRIPHPQRHGAGARRHRLRGRRGETLALVGESGSGKSVTAYAIMGILDAAGAVTAGRIMFGGLDLLAAATERAGRDARPRDLAMIFQNPRTALNPIRPVGKQIADVLLRHGNVTARASAAARAIEMLAQVAHPRSGAARRRLSVRTVGRHVPARHDRDRARLRALAADRRRADHRPRCHHAGGDHGPDRRTRRSDTAWRPC